VTGRQPGLVAVVAGAAWSVPGFRGSERHLAEALAQDGPVLYVDPPRSPSGAVRVGLPGRVGVHVSRPEPGVTRLSIVLPGPERPGLRDIADLLLRRAVRRTAAELGHPVAGAVVAIAHRDLLDPLPGAPRLFWATDDFSAGAALMGLSGDRLRRGESRIAAARIPVLAASPELGRQWAARGCPVTLFPNGVDTARFAERPDAVRPAGPSLAVFAGQLGPRVDPALLLGVAEHVAVRLVGPRLPSADGPLWDQLLAAWCLTSTAPSTRRASP
jgi:teichuronic acid biosynthesis glycosyltransferase TuaH